VIRDKQKRKRKMIPKKKQISKGEATASQDRDTELSGGNDPRGRKDRGNKPWGDFGINLLQRETLRKRGGK